MNATSPEVSGPVRIGLDGKVHLTPGQVEELARNRMKSKYTPGPWHYDEVWSLIIGPEGPEQQICAIHGSQSVPRRQAQSNARLIAAAPDLLKALELCEHVIGMAQLQGKLSDNALSQVTDALVAARKALDKLR